MTMTAEQRAEAKRHLDEVDRLMGKRETRDTSALDAIGNGVQLSSADHAEIAAWLRADDGFSGKDERSFMLPDTETRDNTSTQSVSITGGSAGGYTVPIGFWDNLTVALRAYGGLWNQFRLVRTDTGNPMTWPTNNPTAVYGALLTEDTQITPSNDYTFGLGVMNAWTVVGPLTLVTFQLEEDSAINTQEFVGQRLGEAIGRELSALAWSGTGSSQPLGLTTALAAGSSITPGTGSGSGSSGGGYLALAAANAVTNFGGTTTELAANTLSPNTCLDMIQAIDPAYYDGACFTMNSQQAWGLRGQVDTAGRPLVNLDDGLTQGGVGTVFGFPVVIDNACPNLTASTVGGPVFGNMQHAMVRREVKEVRIMRLVERFADYLCVAYLGWHRADSRSNDLRAAVGVKANSS
jgi:HK97 family phage major capsid protein